MNTTLLNIGEESTFFSLPAITLPLGYQRHARESFRQKSPAAMDVEMASAQAEDCIQATPALRQTAHQAHCNDPWIIEIARIAGSHSILTQEQIERVFNRVADVVSGSPKHEKEYPDEAEFISYLIILREFSHHLGIADIFLQKKNSTN